jgi:D-alanyl-D-alanine carboxypeptidase (penicillin-binding protein 5/6)
MKRALLRFMRIFMFITVGAMSFNTLAYAAPPSIDTHAVGAALIDVESGRILYSKQGDVPLRIASLTKIMTAIVAIEHGNLADTVKVSKNAYAKEGSSIYLKLGEEMSLNNILYGLMLRSGNDAATAIAEHVGGSVEGFVYLMNEKAKLIGMTNSHFNNPSGLDDGKEHYASANDMAKLTAYALKNPVFKEIVKTKQKKVPNPNEKWDYTWFNKNKMLTLFEGADGVKTGYTKLARRCLVSSATRGGQQLAVITLNDSDDWADHARLLAYGFQHYPLKSIINKGNKAAEGSPWVAGVSFSYPLLEKEEGLITQRVELIQPDTTDYRLGERGNLQLLLDGKPIGSVPLYDPRSSRMTQSDASAFDYQASEQYQENSLSRYWRVLKFVVDQMFTLPNDGESFD